MNATTHHPHSLLLILALCAACPKSPAGTESDTDPENSGTTAPGTTTEPTTGTSGVPTTTSGQPTTTGTQTTSPAPSSPDGDLDDGEACDDGNRINGDGCNNDCAPSGEMLVEYRPDTRGFDEVRSIAVDADGTLVIGGGGPDLTGWVARFDEQLTPLWSQFYNQGTSALVLSVALAGSSIYAAGSASIDVDGNDSWVARLAADGTIAWEDDFSSGFGDDYLTQAAVVDDGDLVVTGFASDPNGLTVLWTRRYAADGTEQWTATFPLDETFTIWPLGPGLAVTPDAIVVGWSLPSAMFAELLVAWPPAGGDPLWTQTLANSTGSIMGVAANAGGLVLVGKRDGVLGVRQVTGAGASTWTSDDCTGKNGRDIAVDSQGDIVVIGDGDGATGFSIRLCKFSPDGALRWGKDIDGGFGQDLGYTVAVDAQDRIIAGGAMSAETLSFDPWLAVFSP